MALQYEIMLSTAKKQELIDITGNINSFIKQSNINNGICSIFATHATAAIVINENYDPNICLDLLDALNRLIPGGVWRHDRIDGNADAHIKSAILGPSESVPIKDGKLLLGKWQSVMFVELDGPRKDRRIVVSLVVG